MTHTDHSGSNSDLITGYELDLVSPGCSPGSDKWRAQASLNVDIGDLLPYLNRQLKGADYDLKSGVLIWKDGGNKYAFRQRQIDAAPVRERAEATELLEKAVKLVNDTWKKRNSIEPDFTHRTPPPIMHIYRLLPRTNCGECGFSTCMAFAAELRDGQSEVTCCTVLEEPERQTSREELLALLNPGA